MPWSAKAQELLRRQYAAVGAASRSALAEAVAALDQAVGRDGVVTLAEASAKARQEQGVRRGDGATEDAGALRDRYAGRAAMAADYVDAYRRYCWPVQGVSDLKVAPFHLLATEGAVHTSKDHLWHMETLARLCRADVGATHASPLLDTVCQVVDVTDPASHEAGARWWEALTGRGGEGMVVKPLDFIARGQRGLVQPAVKCRGREYLRIIYGPEYTAPEHLERLRSRSLAGKRSLALREFALGIEALERFVRGEPLRRVHECVFGVLALESEPVDPRL
jgi:protein phosphatase